MSAFEPTGAVFGSVDALRSDTQQITLSIKTPQTADDGTPLSGDYILIAGRSVRYGGRWFLHDAPLRWKSFPDNVVSAEEANAMRLKDHGIKYNSLLPGTMAPDVEFISLTNESQPVRLSSLRGKFVVLYWWLRDGVPHPSAMEKLQALKNTYPHLGDDIVIVSVFAALDLDATRQKIAQQGWTQTLNLWFAQGGYRSEAAKAFYLNGIPHEDVIGRDGRILASGYELATGADRVIAAQLHAEAKAFN